MILKIQKYNEVLLKIDCEDKGILYELNELMKFEVPGAKFMPKYKAGIWSGHINLFNLTKRTLYAGLISDVIEFCKTREYEYEFVDSEFGSPLSKSDVTAKELHDYVKELNPHSQGKKLEVRDYQYIAIFECLKNKRRTVLSPTGSGKSLIQYVVARYLLEQDKRVLIIVPTTGLVDQMASDFEDYSSENDWDAEKNIHCIMGGVDKKVKKPLVITTWQSVFRETPSFFNQFDCICVDECFHGDTKVLTREGWKAIKHIAKGEIVKNINNNGNIKEDIVVNVFKNNSPFEKMYEVSFDTGSVIKVTGNHKVMLQDKTWKRVDELTEKDDVLWLGNHIQL